MSHVSTALVPKQHIEWEWKSNDNVWSFEESEKWTPYCDIDSAIIEEAFQEKLPEAILDDYHIVFEQLRQISNNDEMSQRPVRRSVNKRTTQSGRLREERFVASAVAPETSFGLPSNCQFLEEACQQNLGLSYDEAGDPALLSAIVEKAAEGIVIEGKKASKQKRAEWMAQKLLSVKKGTRKEVAECCAELYSHDSFLYRKLNESMRLQTDKLNTQHQKLWRMKARTLGLFAFLLEMLPNPLTDKKMTVYRGADFSESLIDQYRQSAGDWSKGLCFLAFSSTSRSRDKAEFSAGNILFILDINEDEGRDVAPYSTFDEEETLLIPPFFFSIQSCQFDKIINKWIIHLRSHRSY
ncbi:unnamed protein product [Adineta ricciae]|uniref:NAD(P)(+)--arginine ADP-ribosyltransferase n=1 Tax=Adineta ricciae TaxID=249248 RepID=A0A816CM36_ADIRI|nr:unnamed protein product [Adineta ricciae]CAF1623008.1 unnamed protein product [Adineta ricciae]